ncbi:MULTISPECIES: ATP-dependent sacrificial sulfur transferase LarE [Shewanella]|nr:ATP-dependent sacrificial sulfur transferase LarE [Shewanella psychromarinicola]MCL1080500.1 ATP-dependent sacrificial sulfur transferase LarE [Shewanella psychromarinicola]
MNKGRIYQDVSDSIFMEKVMSEKYIELVSYLKGLKRVLVAFSGGVDSTFLLKAAKDALGDNAAAVTVNSPYIPSWEIEEAKEFTEKMGIKHDFIKVGIIDEIKNNPSDRCYLCKKALFSMIKEKAINEGFDYVIDGTNLDDIKDYRPGIKALNELKIVSPLLECKITKSDVREMSKDLNLLTWNKPAGACLLTRIPFDTRLEIDDINRIEKAEKYLRDKGIAAVRVRSHGDLARIEIDPTIRDQLFNTDFLDEISRKLKEYGFKYVTIDAAGYKMGSLNS